MSFAERLNHLLDERRLSQADLALAVDMSKSTVSEWANDKSMPAVDKAIRLAKHFGVSLDYLFGLVDEPRPPVAEETDQERTLRHMVEAIGFDEAIRRLMAAPGVKYVETPPTYGQRAEARREAEAQSPPRLKRDA